MINLVEIHNRIAKTQGNNEINNFYYYIVIIGAGGNGGYAIQRITKMMNAFEEVKSFLLIADPDVVEKRNLLRQPFIRSDIGQKKSEVLAKRYGTTYALRVGTYSNSYVESLDQIEELFSFTDYRHSHGRYIQKVLIGAVDNDYSRNLMNEYFQQTDDIIYIDAGIEGIFVPDGDKPESQWSEQEKQDYMESGYSGQVVVGIKKSGQIILEPIGDVYPIDSNDSIPPSHACGVLPYQPQRMIANEMAAFQVSTVINELFASNSVIIHYTNFSARSATSRTVYAEDSCLLSLAH